MRKALLLNEKDNVAIALTNLKRGEEVELSVQGINIKVKLLNDIPFGHKFSIREIKEGEYVVKYGEVIGIATKNIGVGEHVQYITLKG